MRLWLTTVRRREGAKRGKEKEKEGEKANLEPLSLRTCIFEITFPFDPSRSSMSMQTPLLLF